MIDFAQLSIEEAHERTLVLAVQAKAAPRLGFGAPPASAAPYTLSLDVDHHAALNDLLLKHVDAMGLIDLASPSMCDVFLNTATRDFLEEAARAGVGNPRSGVPAWLTALGDVAMLMFADEARLQAEGPEALVELAHESELRDARSAGRPHNAQALTVYDARATSAQGEAQH